MSIYRNSEGYYDPTAGEALARITRKERSDRRKAARKKRNREHRTEVWKNANVSGGKTTDGHGSVSGSS